MLKVKEVVSYKIENLAELSILEVLGLAVISAGGDEEALYAVSDIAHSRKCSYSDDGTHMRLEAERGIEPSIDLIVVSGGTEIKLMIESRPYDERVVHVSDVWSVDKLTTMVDTEVE
jgi:hypothetical protein